MSWMKLILGASVFVHMNRFFRYMLIVCLAYYSGCTLAEYLNISYSLIHTCYIGVKMDFWPAKVLLHYPLKAFLIIFDKRGTWL